MLKFVTFAVKTQLNVHDLNNETVAGNVTDIRIMEFLDENGEKKESPAVSGRMLKHWHYEAMRLLALQQNLSLCDACKIGEPVRPAKLTSDNKLSHQEAINEGIENVIKKCAICDIHGFLAAIGTTSERRSSRAMFSWLMPIISVPSKQVIHSRVKSGKDFKEEALTSQMPFNKSYASGIYAFVSTLDVERIGLVELNLSNSNNSDPYAVNNDNGRKDRIKVAIEAYRYLISGQMGASLSHAIPHMNPLEILVAYSEKGPLPFPVSPMYSDYITKTKGLVPEHATLLYYGSSEPEGVIKKNSINEIFAELLNKVG
ncbi:MAG TPA: DevR family CRISPR-associated autoregulator [Candidatus Desulfofervidus auxilii]|uniref:DevR family CRISPR-associated autoregulator n=1 Tax=Desulfofervidus auxilii TaxID=1621989 RepID=A0A7C1VWB0_DESA2|nr:DevR family CRISPR-associated autoregulator [Candidatus Desulfofervidus auxilii]